MPIGTPLKSQEHHRLLTLREAMREYGLYKHLIYAAVERGLVHQVKPNGRTLYPEWEVALIKERLTRTYTAAAA